MNQDIFGVKINNEITIILHLTVKRGRRYLKKEDREMDRKRVVSLTLLFLLLMQIFTVPLAATPVSAAAKSGLQKANGKICYYDAKGRKVRNTWKTVQKNRYYFGKDGAAYKGYKKVGADRYYFDSDCRMVKDKTVKIKGKKYYFLKNGKAAKTAVRLSNKKVWKVTAGGRLLKDITADAKIGKNFDTFIQKAGKPKKSHTTPSCNGPGRDGIYTYDNFQIYTYEESGVRKIIDLGDWI